MKSVIIGFLVVSMFIGQTWRTRVEDLLRMDLLLHFLCYMMLAFAGIIFKPEQAISICATVWLFGLGMEVWQQFIGRGFCWRDLAANTIGILTAFVIQYFLKN